MEKGIGKGWLILATIFVILVLFGLSIVGKYNSLVGLDTTVEQKWGNVQTAYQRRADLIPNLVDTVKGYRDFEKETLTEITALRSQAGQTQSSVQSAKTPAELQAASGEMSSVLSRLLVIVEAYPDLKASQNFLALQDELAGTENRIKWERDEYNIVVKNYKQATRTFPGNIIAGMFGFSTDKWAMFEAEAGAEKAPKVNFD